MQIRKPRHKLLTFLCWFLGCSLHFWSILALYYCSFPGNPTLTITAAIGYIIVVIVILFSVKNRKSALLVSLIGFLAVAAWFNSIQPKTNASYPEELTPAYAEFNADMVTIHNVRNCDYRTKDDFDVNYESRTYNLSELKTLDVYMNYWGMEEIAHAFLSFGFSDG